MNGPIQQLQKYVGKFLGNGINHENESFLGELEIKPMINAKGLMISFCATGKDETIFHQEETIIAPTETENIALWTLNSNVPYFYKHDYVFSEPVEGATATFKFYHNKPEDLQSFREEIAIDLWPDGNISYRYSWGMPGGDYKERSGLRLARKS